MKLDLLDRLERLHAERLIKRLRDPEYWGTGVMIEKSTLGEAADALASVPALVAALRLTVEALRTPCNNWDDGCSFCRTHHLNGVVALAKIESLMATEEPAK